MRAYPPTLVGSASEPPFLGGGISTVILRYSRFCIGPAPAKVQGLLLSLKRFRLGSVRAPASLKVASLRFFSLSTDRVFPVCFIQAMNSLFFVHFSHDACSVSRSEGFWLSEYNTHHGIRLGWLYLVFWTSGFLRPSPSNMPAALAFQHLDSQAAA